MTNVLSAELYKLRYSVIFYICIIVAILVSVFGSFTNTDETVAVIFQSTAGNLTFFLIIVITGIACDDYEKSTVKNLISSGNSRSHIYGGKLLTSIVVGLIFFIVDSFFGVISAYLINGMGSGITALSMMESLAVQLLLMGIFVLTFFGISSIVKTSKFGLILGVLYTLGAAFIPWALGSFVFHVNLEAFSIDTLMTSIQSLRFSSQTIINFLLYGGIAVILNVIGYLRFKKEEV